jgi:chemotaxis signal transduction protein
MPNSLVNYKGIDVKKDLYHVIKYIEDVDKYREELGRLSSSWDILALLGQLGDINIDIGKTKDNFLNLTSTLLNHLGEQTLKKVTSEMKFKSQVAIDIVIRNLFERTADIGFLATDDDIRNYLENYVSDYNEESTVLKKHILERFKEYVAKYSVYFDIVLVNPNGKIVARLDDNIKTEKVDTSFVQSVLNASEEYVETYKHHDFIPQYKKSLVYSYKVNKTNDSNSESLGVLCLCFKFTNEMAGIFKNLVDKNNKEVISILDVKGQVIASSDKEHLPLNTKVQIVLDDDYKVVSYMGRNYIAKTCVTNGYQGFMGLKWYGHIMIPLEYAFLSDISNDDETSDDIIEAMMSNEQHFSKDLKDVFLKSKTIQENLNRVIWNGNISQSKVNSTNRGFSKSLLNEIGLTGMKANSSLSNLNQTIISSILKDSEFLSSLAIDVMDRNLYERANDCRWWALTSYFRDLLDDMDSISHKKAQISSILRYINDLYTVYTNLFIFDKEGKVIAVSNPKDEYLVGKILNNSWVGKTTGLRDTSKYCVSCFEETNLYDNKSTYIYCAAIRSNKNQKIVNGGIGVVFDSTPEFEAMLEETLPKDENNQRKKGYFAVFTDRSKKIISSTSPKYTVDSYLNIDDKFFDLDNGLKHSEIIVLDGKYYAVGARCSKGYREYKSASDDYKNDVICLVFVKIGKVESKTNLLYNQNDKFNIPTKKVEGDSIELATFNIGEKYLAVYTKNVVDSIGIDSLIESIEIDKSNHFKGMVIHNERLISILDIRSFINTEIADEELTNIILLEYDKENKEHCIGLLVSSLETIITVEEKSIQQIENHFLGGGTLVQGLVDISTGVDSKVAMVLDIKKIDENLTKND